MAASRVPQGVGAGAGAVDVPLPAAREMGDAARSSSLVVSHHLEAIRGGGKGPLQATRAGWQGHQVVAHEQVQSPVL